MTPSLTRGRREGKAAARQSHIGERTQPSVTSHTRSAPHAQFDETQESGHSTPQAVGQQGPSRQRPPVEAQSVLGVTGPVSTLASTPIW
jgi:hypothetical protein